MTTPTDEDRRTDEERRGATAPSERPSTTNARPVVLAGDQAELKAARHSLRTGEPMPLRATQPHQK